MKLPHAVPELPVSDIQAAAKAYGLQTVTIWLNMDSSAEVDQLHAPWRDRGVHIATELHTAPYNLREFTAQDLDGNRIRVFYDLGGADR